MTQKDTENKKTETPAADLNQIENKLMSLESTSTLAHQKNEWCITLVRDLVSDYFEIADTNKAVEKIFMEFDRVRNLLQILENIHFQLWDDCESIEGEIEELLQMTMTAKKQEQSNTKLGD